MALANLNCPQVGIYREGECADKNVTHYKASAIRRQDRIRSFGETRGLSGDSVLSVAWILSSWRERASAWLDDFA